MNLGRKTESMDGLPSIDDETWEIEQEDVPSRMAQ